MNFALDPVERRVIDNRTFMIGLDDLYRSSMREFEATRLLACARTVARALGAEPDAGPVEGYYAESPALTEYFQLMRALQQRDDGDAPRVKRLREFTLLHAIATSGLYGRAEAGGLLPRCIDALGLALEQEAPNGWSMAVLAERARSIAIETGDFSLVALGARTGDPVVLAATRETVVLHSVMMCLGDDAPIEHVWQVDDELSTAANRFIQTLNQFGASPLPPAIPASAEQYYDAAEGADLAGRCAAIGFDPESQRYYHWAIAGRSIHDFYVEEFWESELWTTNRYQSQQILKGGW